MSFGNPQIISASGSSVAPTPPGPRPAVGGPGSSSVVYRSPPGGLVKQNGTPVFATVTAPNDGAVHFYRVTTSLNVTVAETGGAVVISRTIYGTTANVTVWGGGSGITSTSATFIIAVDPNTTWTLQQSTALTAGTSVYDIAIDQIS